MSLDLETMNEIIDESYITHTILTLIEINEIIILYEDLLPNY
jgi:hypothetical protein